MKATKEELLGVLNGFEVDLFPRELCTKRNEREPSVFNADVEFIVALWDARFEELTLRRARPYTAKPVDYADIDPAWDVLYGWEAAEGDEVFDHHERSIHLDTRVVVAWRRV